MPRTYKTLLRWWVRFLTTIMGICKTDKIAAASRSHIFNNIFTGSMTICVIKLLKLKTLKQLQPLAINISNRFGIIRNNDIILDPVGCPAPFDHLVDLIIDAGPEIAAAFSVE